MNSIGERIKIVRAEFKLNQKEFAQKLGTTQKSISEYERGITSINESVIVNLIKVFKIDSNWLLIGQGEMFIDESKYLESKSNSDNESYIFSKKVMEDFKSLNENSQKAIYLEILKKLKEDGKI